MTLTKKVAPVFVVLAAVVLALPAIYKLQQNPVSANVQKQVAAPTLSKQSRSDAPAKTKQPGKPRAPKGNAPPNDNCANAIAITECPFDAAADTTGAGDEVGEPQSTCTLQANSVWYSYTTGDTTAILMVQTCASDFDTAVMVWKVNGAACDFANFSPVACNDDFCGNGLQSTVSFNADPNSSYKIQIGGFDGETGNLAVHVDCTILNCPPVVINGTLGSGSEDFDGVQFSGNQTGRLNRNGIASSCAAPKTCLIFDPANSRAFDAYVIPNDSGEDACVSIHLSEDSKETCNSQSNAYLDTYNPASICTGYLGDPGLSTGVPPTATNFSVVVPAGHDLIVVVHTTNPGESGCGYTLTILGDLCAGFDVCVQDTQNPKRFIQISTTTGKYKFTDCGKNLLLEGEGGVASYFCKTELFDRGPNPKRPDRFVDVVVNPCTGVGDATINFGINRITLHDTNIFDNTCACPGAQ
jgi:hypothetical protein